MLRYCYCRFLLFSLGLVSFGLCVHTKMKSSTNECLKEMLRANFTLELPKYAANHEGDVAPDPFDYLKQIQPYLARKEASNRWQIVPKVVLQTFSFQKIAMSKT